MHALIFPRERFNEPIATKASKYGIVLNSDEIFLEKREYTHSENGGYLFFHPRGVTGMDFSKFHAYSRRALNNVR